MALFSHSYTWLWLRRASWELLCCDIFINEQEAEVNIVLIKSTVDTNQGGTASQGEAQILH